MMSALEPKPVSHAGKFFMGLGLGCALMLAMPVLLILALSIFGPSAEAVPGKTLSTGDLEFLRELKVLEQDETVIYFYSGGLWSIEENGSFITDRKIVAYEQGDDVDTMEMAAYAEVKDIKIAYSEDFFTSSVITVMRKSGSEFILCVDNAEHGDRKFYNRLMKEWRKHYPVGKED